MGKNTKSAGKGVNPQYATRQYRENDFWDGKCWRHPTVEVDYMGNCPRCWEIALSKKEEWKEKKDGNPTD